MSPVSGSSAPHPGETLRSGSFHGGFGVLGAAIFTTELSGLGSSASAGWVDGRCGGGPWRFRGATRPFCGQSSGARPQCPVVRCRRARRPGGRQETVCAGKL